MIIVLAFLLLSLMPIFKQSNSCSFTVSDKNIALTIESNFKSSDTLFSNYTVKNISNRPIFIIKDGYSDSEQFPLDNSIVLLNLTDSKLGAGNGHYFHNLRIIEPLLPNQIVSFSTSYLTPKSELKKIILVYEYLPTDKKIKNNKILGKDLVRLAQKLKVECPCYFNNN